MDNIEDVSDSIQSALEGSPSQRKIAELGLRVVDLLLRKNKDYGDSAWTPPALARGVPVRTAIAVRMSDKLSRWQQLMEASGGVSESLEKTMVDFIGYGILWLGAEELEAEDLWEIPPKLVGVMSPSLVTGLSEEWPDGRGTPEYDAMPPILEQVRTEEIPPCGEGYRYVDPATDKPDPRAEVWDEKIKEWVSRNYPYGPYIKNLVYRVPRDSGGGS